MMLPGLISVVFYRRPPSRTRVGLGLVATIVFSAALGYVLPGGALGRVGSVILAVVSAVLLYAAILAYLVYVYQPARASRRSAAPPSDLP